jgi:hypothetical protein
MITDPYRPSIRKVAPNDPPFIAKRSQELPAGQNKFGLCNIQKTKGEDSHIDTSQGVPEFQKGHCQKNRVIGRSNIPNTGSRTLRTVSLLGQNEIDHSGRQSIRWI